MQSIEGVEPLHLFRAVIAFVADQLADEKAVFLLHVSIVVFAIRAAARETNVVRSAEGFQMGV